MAQPTQPPLPPGLALILAEFDQAQRRLEALVESTDEHEWGTRPPGGGWSAAECVAHLNATSGHFLTAIHDGLRSGTASGLVGDDPVRVDMWGRLLLWWLEPPYRTGSKTPAAFQPASAPDRRAALQQFTTLQEAVCEAIRTSRGLQISKIKIASPFDARLRYSLTSAFRLIPCHQRRHLWQAERAVASVRGAGQGAS